MAVVRAFMSKLLIPRKPVLKTMQWRITSAQYSSKPGLSTGSGPQINVRPEGDVVTDEDQEQNGVNTSNSISINEDEASRPGLSTGSGPQINFLPQGDAVSDEDQEQNGVNTSNNISIN
ncbi:hypothetical protein M0R45_014570 [Rubus argutus]|uniref:Uncharacterized protein n=1 Tax=Rubus argutus TaxID=59490 RepID=A0AAW1XLM7_RUBAR